MILRRRFLQMTSGIAVAGLAACGSAPAQYYRLAAIPGPVLNTAVNSVRIRNITIPGYLDQNNIAKTSGTYQFASYPNDLWADSLSGMLQTTLVQNLAQRLPRMTVTGSGAIGAPAGLLVEINILRFDPEASGNIVLIVQYAVKNADGGFLVTKTAQSSAAPASGDAAGIAAAMSALWAGFANEVAGDLVG